MAGDIKVAVVSGALNTGATATTDFTVTDFGTVKAAKIVLTFDATDDANSDTELKFCIGLTDFTNSRYVTCQSEDGSLKEDADCGKGVNDGYFLLTVGGGDDGHGDVTAITDGVRLTNQAVFGRAVFVKITLYGGADLAVDCGSHVLTNRTPDVSTNSTTTGIDQDIVLFIGVDLAPEDSAGTAINASFGVASTGREASQSIVNRCQSFTVDHNATVGSPIGAIRNNRCLSMITEGAGLDWGVELTAADGTSFTTTMRDADPGAGMEVYYLALGFAAASPRHKSEVGSIDSPVVAGNWSKTGLGFKPGFVELGVNRLTAENTIAEDATAGSVGLSENAGSGEEACHSFYDEFGTPTINTNNCFRSRAIYLFEDDGATIAYDLSHLTFNLDGWTYSQVGTPSGTASKWDYLVFEETGIPPVSGTGIQTLPSLIQAGVGVLVFTATSAQALPATTQAGVGIMLPSGAGAQTVAPVVQAGAGVQTFAGTSVQTVASLLQAGAGIEVFTATGAQALAALLQSAVGLMQPSGAGVQTLAALIQTGSGVQIFVGTGVQVLAALLQSGVGLMQPSGTGVLVLPATTQDGVGVVPTEGAGVQTLAAMLQAGVGLMLPSGAGVQTVAALTQVGEGVQIFIGTGAQVLAALLQAGVGAEKFVVTGAQALASTLQAGAGLMQPSGVGAQALAALLQAGVGVEKFVGNGVQTLAPVLQNGVGLMQPSGVGTQVLAALLQVGAGIEVFTGTGVQTLAKLLQSGAGVVPPSGEGAQLLAALVQAGVGYIQDLSSTGTGAQTFAAVTQVGSGTQIFVGTGVQILAALTQAGIGVGFVIDLIRITSEITRFRTSGRSIDQQRDTTLEL